jgi:hypothetical protein
MSDIATAFTTVVGDVSDTALELLPILGGLLALFIGIAVGVRLIRKFARA